MRLEEPKTPSFILSKNKVNSVRRDRQIEIDSGNKILLKKIKKIKDGEDASYRQCSTSKKKDSKR